MDPFTQRMLERARARQEKIDQKLANSGQVVPKRKPLSENLAIIKSDASLAKSPSRQSKEDILSPKRASNKTETPKKSPNRRSSQKTELSVATSQKPRNDVIVNKKEFQSPKRGSLTRRNSDVSVEINIMHRNDIQIEVQVEEREVPISLTYDSGSESGSGVTVKEIEDNTSKSNLELEMQEAKSERTGLRNNMKSRLDRLGNLYSDTPNLSSPIHRTEQEFSSATPPAAGTPREPRVQPKEGKRKFGRLAALADQINNWEDDLTHHSHHPETTKTTNIKQTTSQRQKQEHKLGNSTLDISIHSIKDINKVINSASKNQATKQTKSTFKKPTNGCRLDTKIVAELEGEGYRRVSASQSRLVYDFTTETADPVRQEPSGASTTLSAAAAPDMATMVSTPPANPTIAKKPSLKKYKAPTPPQKIDCESETNKENSVVNDDDADDVCIQTKSEPTEKLLPEKGSPALRRLPPKQNNADRSSVLSKAAFFESGSPRSKEKDPAEMSLRERKALFEKNKGAAIVPKAPFGLAPSVKTLHGETKEVKPIRPVVQPNQNQPKTPTKSKSKESLHEDNISQTSVGGIKGKLAALFSKEQTISETTIANKFKQEREKEMAMLQNRFYKPKDNLELINNESDEDGNEHDPSEKMPLMGSTLSLSQSNKKPEIIGNIPKTDASNDSKIDDKLAQPVKRPSTQESPVMLSVEDVKRIKVITPKPLPSKGPVLQQPASLYPHLSDIETDGSNTQEEYSDCGGSSTENCESANEKLNKSDNWADTSFGREVMNVVKRNNTSYRRAVRESDSDSDGGSAGDSELDDMLDEALQDECEGPTPPKVNKHGSVTSASSFVLMPSQEYRSPVKAPPTTPAARPDRGNELVHSVSFYRRMQNASSTPTTPMRVIRHCSPEREGPNTPDATAAASVTTVRQRIKELRDEIVKQQTVISQASQALNLCASTIEFSGSTEQAEGERLLLLASHRRAACVQESQRLQVEGAGPAAAAGMASLSLKSLAVPLRRDYVRQLNADGAVGHHAVLLIKCRDRVAASSMQLTSPTSTTLTFPDEIRMDGLSSDFKVTVEVYLLPASKEVLPHDVKYHISSKKSSSKLLTPKSKVSELKTPRVQSPGGPLAVRSPQFALHGYCIFALPQANRNSFTLNKVPLGSPLEGVVNVEISARVKVPMPGPHGAFLTAFDDVSGLGAWHRRWFRLQPPRLAYWKYPDDVQKKMPIGDIDLSTVISDKVTKAPRELCARPHTILLESSVPAGLILPDTDSLVYTRRPDGTVVRRHLLAADTAHDRDAWLDCLNKALEYVRCCGTDD